MTCGGHHKLQHFIACFRDGCAGKRHWYKWFTIVTLKLLELEDFKRICQHFSLLLSTRFPPNVVTIVFQA